MRLTKYVLLVMLCLVWAGTAHGQFMKNEIILSAGAGLTDPTGPFEDEMRTGLNATVSALMFLNPSWAIGVRGAYTPLDAEPVTNANSGLTDIVYYSVDVEAELMLYPDSWFTPYISGGLGLALEQSNYAPPNEAPRTTDMLRAGLTMGVGLSLHRQTRWWSLFTELVYNHYPVEDGSRQFVRWTTGLRISFGGRPF